MLVALIKEHSGCQATLDKSRAGKWLGIPVIRRPKNKVEVTSTLVHLQGDAGDFIQKVRYAFATL